MILTLPIADALELYHQAFGAGPPVLLLHGLFGSGNNLGQLGRHLGTYRSLRVDLRNHGRSPHTATMNYPLMIADIVRFLDRHDIARCAVIGHSMGGKVAMGLALTQPQRVAALVVVDICPVSYDHGRHDEVIDAMEGLPLASLSGRKQADQLLREKIVEADIRQFLLSNLYQKQGSWSWRCNLVALSSNRHALAMAPTGGGAYPGPTLFIKGANSDYIGEHCGEAISRQFPQAQLRIISAAGHWPHAEKPVTFNGVVSRFLHRVYPAQSGDRA